MIVALKPGVTRENRAQLMDWLRDDLKISADYSDTDARLIAGVRYELQLRKLGVNNTVRKDDAAQLFPVK